MKEDAARRGTRLLIMAMPVTWGLGVVLARFATWGTTAGSLVRPALVVALISIILLLVARVLGRNWTWAALASSAVVLLGMREGLPGGLLAVTAIWLMLVDALRRIARRPLLPEPTLLSIGRAPALFAVAFAVVMGWQASSEEINGVAPATYPIYDSTGPPGPDIYLIVLDGYPRADTIAETFGMSVQDFERDLSSLGFTISAGARSNYQSTWLTFASMLNGAYISDMLDADPPPTISGQWRWLHSMIDHAALLDVLESRGYRIRTIPSPFTTTALSSADDYIDLGYATDFEARLIAGSAVALLAPETIAQLLANGHRALVLDSLETTARLAEERVGPQFVLAHIESPHTPFVLHPRESDYVVVPSCFPTACSLFQATMQELGLTLDAYADAMRYQIEALNSHVIMTVERIVEADPEAVVILMSDHGSRYSLEDPDEHFRNLLAARTPGAEGLFDQTESPVNLLRLTLNAYLDVPTAALPYRSWGADWEYPLELGPPHEYDPAD